MKNTFIFSLFLLQIFFLTSCWVWEKIQTKTGAIVPTATTNQQKTPQEVPKTPLSTWALMRTIAEKIEWTWWVEECEVIIDDGDKTACTLSILIAKWEKKNCRILSSEALMQKCSDKMDFRDALRSWDIDNCSSLSGNSIEECKNILSNKIPLFNTKKN